MWIVNRIDEIDRRQVRVIGYNEDNPIEMDRNFRWVVYTKDLLNERFVGVNSDTQKLLDSYREGIRA